MFVWKLNYDVMVDTINSAMHSKTLKCLSCFCSGFKEYMYFFQNELRNLNREVLI